MKANMKKIIALVLVFALCLSVAAFAAETRASNFINSKVATASSGNGITVTFTIRATGTMTDLGATKIVIKTYSGTTVKTYNYTDDGFAYLLGHNCSTYTASVSYPGFPGNQYYAVVYFKAGNSSGSETTTYTTNLATAVKDY
ncbi:acid shock protein [Butyricicoccus sp.]|uniref:acid shock protein n=1 Tax=Butyricicoccus sp. TaxID=2049021 RepID=UPI0037353DAD